MKKILIMSILLGSIYPAAALRIEYGGTVTISQPVREDLYITAGTVTINAPVYGDLIVIGGTVVINDTITSDILVAGGRVTFNGFAGDDIRCAGGNIRISKNVAGDVVAAGGEVLIDNGISVGSLVTSAGNITVNGAVTGEMRGSFDKLVLNGNVSKDINCSGQKIEINGTVDGKSIIASRTIVIGSNAIFNKDVRYWNKQGSVDFKQSLRNSKSIYDPSLHIAASEWYYLGAASILGLLWYLGMALLMIMILQYLFAATFKKAAFTIFSNTVKSIGYGLLFFIAIPIAAVIAFITLIGVPVGLLLVFSYIILAMLSTVIVSVVVANWFNNRNKYQWHYRQLVFAAFGVFVVLKLLSSTPVAGWLLMCLLACMSFGGIILNINWKGKRALAPAG